MSALTFVLLAGVVAMNQAMERKTCTAPDGVRIVYSAAGAGDTALVFVHGGMADRTFYDRQLQTLASRYRVVALDLAGHGESGANRTSWGMPQFGADVKAVADAERLTRVVLLGNSLGGPVAVEAALLMPDRVIGVVGIDTFQDLGAPRTSERAREEAAALRSRAEAFKSDYQGAMRAMVAALFHKDADSALVARTEQRMLKTPATVTYPVLMSLATYDFRDAVRRLQAPLRTINGDLYPTDVAGVRALKPDFDAVIMPHTGHYPMLERPDAFDGHVVSVVSSLESAAPRRR